VWGDNNALNTAPLFSVNPTNQYFLGGPQVDSVVVSRAWVEFQVPVGLMRVGRMPSHWGMGILSNGGGSGNWDPLTPPGKPKRKTQDTYFDDDFGDNHFGSTNDRILFATRPMTIFKTIKKKADTSSNFVMAYAFDKLSEAPLLLAEDDRLYRPFGQSGFLSRGEKQDDVNEHVIVAAYSNPDWDKVRYTDELKVGTYWVFRTQEQGFTEPSDGAPHHRGPAGQCFNDDETVIVDEDLCVTSDEGSFVWIADVWYRIRYGFWYSEGEAVHIGGETTGGVPFPGTNIRKKASINGAVIRFGYLTPKWDALIEFGHSSGDTDLGDLNFNQRPLHPDFNVGLILFEEIVRERMARVFGPPLINGTAPDGARGFFSNGGVVNANYIMPKGRFRPGFGGFEFVGQVLIAFVDEYTLVPPNVFVCPNEELIVDDMGVPTGCNMSTLLGTEIDVAVKSRFANDLLDFSLEAGYLMFGDLLKNYTSAGLKNPNPADGSFTIQARIAMIF
jgi:hypothetical protein